MDVDRTGYDRDPDDPGSGNRKLKIQGLVEASRTPVGSDEVRQPFGSLEVNRGPLGCGKRK